MGRRPEQPRVHPYASIERVADLDLQGHLSELAACSIGARDFIEAFCSDRVSMKYAAPAVAYTKNVTQL